MNTYTFQIDDLVIPFTAAVSFNQDYERLTAVTTIRTQNGTGIRQGVWTKIKTTLSGSGFFPLGLSDLDPFEEHTLYCGSPMSVSSTLNALLLPTERRIDAGYEPTGMALVGDDMVDTIVTTDGNIATCAPVPGATGYRVSYYPRLQVFIEAPKETTDLRAASFGWSLVCEEV